MKVAWFAGAILFLACTRHAEIENAPDAGALPVMEVPLPDGGVPLVQDADLTNPDGLVCNKRPSQPACTGADAFGCKFDSWLQTLAETCQQHTDCHTNGWVEVVIGPEGCATELHMEDPDPAYVACITEQLDQYSCPCKNVLGSRFLGLSHNGCGVQHCTTGELRCPPGSSCHDDLCVPDNSSGGAAGAGGQSG